MSMYFYTLYKYVINNILQHIKIMFVEKYIKFMYYLSVYGDKPESFWVCIAGQRTLLRLCDYETDLAR